MVVRKRFDGASWRRGERRWENALCKSSTLFIENL
jgi:hypothetical protein